MPKHPIFKLKVCPYLTSFDTECSSSLFSGTIFVSTAETMLNTRGSVQPSQEPPLTSLVCQAEVSLLLEGHSVTVVYRRWMEASECATVNSVCSSLVQENIISDVAQVSLWSFTRVPEVESSPLFPLRLGKSRTKPPVGFAANNTELRLSLKNIFMILQLDIHSERHSSEKITLCVHLNLQTCSVLLHVGFMEVRWIIEIWSLLLNNNIYWRHICLRYFAL